MSGQTMAAGSDSAPPQLHVLCFGRVMFKKRETIFQGGLAAMFDL